MGILSFTLLLFAATAQDVEVFKGTATVTLDTKNHETNIVYRAHSTAEPLYFVLQHEDGVALPAKWSGPARLFLADGVLALVAGSGKAQLFKFPERGIPASLIGKFPFEVIPTYGIARYGHEPPAH